MCSTAYYCENFMLCEYATNIYVYLLKPALTVLEALLVPCKYTRSAFLHRWTDKQVGFSLQQVAMRKSFQKIIIKILVFAYSQ